MNSNRTGTVWDNIISTAEDIQYTNIPTTFETKLNNLMYVNPVNGNNSVWTNSNTTKHMEEYISRFDGETPSTGIRSQEMLDSYAASLNKAMASVANDTPRRYFGTYGNWEIGVNTEIGVVYHARMLK